MGDAIGDAAAVASRHVTGSGVAISIEGVATIGAGVAATTTAAAVVPGTDVAAGTLVASFVASGVATGVASPK